MPIYVYECSSCGERFEYMQSIHDPPKSVCEKCEGKLEKVIVPTAFLLKGGGWYKDLYSSQKSAKSGESVSSQSAEEAKGSSKTESKTESKSDGAASQPKGPSGSSGGDK